MGFDLTMVIVSNIAELVFYVMGSLAFLKYLLKK